MKTIVSLFMLVCLSAGLVAGPVAGFHPAALPGEEHIIPQAGTVTRYMTISGLDFRPSVPTNLYTLTGSGSIYPDSVPAQFSARVDLPDDASVTDVTFFFVDNNPSANMTFMFKKDSPSADISLDIWQPVSNTSSGSQLQSISLCPPICNPVFIGTGTYSYHLQVDFSAAGSAQVLYGARSTYTEPAVPVPDNNLTLVGTDFLPMSSQTNFDTEGMRVFCPGNLSFCSFIAPIFLPQGSQIIEIVYYVVDNSSAKNLDLHLISFNPLAESLALLNDSSTASLPASIDPQSLTVSGNPLATIDNSTRSYAIVIQPTVASMEQQIVGVHIHYTPGTASNFRARTLAGYDFAPNLSKVDYNIQGGMIFPQDAGSIGPLTANLDLPDGNVVYSLTMYYKKLIGASGNFTFAVKSYHPADGDADVLQSYNTNTVQPGDALQQLSFIGTIAGLGKMDTRNTSLRLEVTPSAPEDNLVLYGARVQYYSPTGIYLPVIKN